MNTRKYFIIYLHCDIFVNDCLKSTLWHILLFLLYMMIVMLDVIFVFVLLLHTLSEMTQ